MRFKRSIAAVWSAALLLSAAALADPSPGPIALLAPAASAVEAVDAVATALRAGDPAKAERLAGLALGRHDLTDTERTHVLLNRGLAREQSGKHRAALGDFSKALRDKTLSAETRARALFDRGIARDELGHPVRAIADYSAALKLVPGFPAALNNRANAYRRLGRLSDARRDYEASLAAGNTEPQYSNYGLGQIAEAQGNPLAAQDYYKRALTADPRYVLAQQRLAALGKTMTQAAFVLHPPVPEARSPAPPSRPRDRATVTRVSYGVADSIPELRPAILGVYAHKTAARVQLGAYRDEADAALGWNRLTVQARGLLGGLTPQIVSVEIPGRGRFYRLRAGPVANGDANALCGRLKSRGLACLPVKG